jgi:hypothetical protein
VQATPSEGTFQGNDHDDADIKRTAAMSMKSWLQEDFFQTTSKTATNWMWPAMGSKKPPEVSPGLPEYFCCGPQTLRLGRIV